MEDEKNEYIFEERNYYLIMARITYLGQAICQFVSKMLKLTNKPDIFNLNYRQKVDSEKLHRLYNSYNNQIKKMESEYKSKVFISVDENNELTVLYRTS